MLKDRQYVGNTSELTARLFAKVSRPPNKLYEEGHYIQNIEKKLEGEGAICNFSTLAWGLMLLK